MSPLMYSDVYEDSMTQAERPLSLCDACPRGPHDDGMWLSNLLGRRYDTLRGQTFRRRNKIWILTT